MISSSKNSLFLLLKGKAYQNTLKLMSIHNSLVGLYFIIIHSFDYKDTLHFSQVKGLLHVRNIFNFGATTKSNVHPQAGQDSCRRFCILRTYDKYSSLQRVVQVADAVWVVKTWLFSDVLRSLNYAVSPWCDCMQLVPLALVSRLCYV